MCDYHKVLLDGNQIFSVVRFFNRVGVEKCQPENRISIWIFLKMGVIYSSSGGINYGEYDLSK